MAGWRNQSVVWAQYQDGRAYIGGFTLPAKQSDYPMPQNEMKVGKRKLLALLLTLFLAIFVTITFAAPDVVIHGLRLVHAPIPSSLKEHARERLIKHLQARAASGDCAAQYQLAVQLHNRQFPHQYGTAMQGDARKWLIRSAENGCIDGMTEIGRYADEAGDYNEAFRWYLKASQLGDPYSEWIVGGYYEDGKGVARSSDKALQWFKRAQNSGFEAEVDIARVYAEEQNFIEAHYWYSRALEAGDGFAAQELGQCYGDGGGCRGFCDSRMPCPRDMYKRYLWLRIASLYRKCLECYRDVIPLLSSEQISNAEAEASTWVQRHPKRAEGL